MFSINASVTTTFKIHYYQSFFKKSQIWDIGKERLNDLYSHHLCEFPFLKPKSCKKLLQFPKFPSSLCEKTFFVCFFPCYSIISSSAAYSFCTKDPCSILDKIAKTFETTSVSPCISKNKALLYILQQIDNY